jgi:hypothetical protein
MKKTHNIEFDSKIAKILHKMLTILLVVASLLFCYGAVTSGQAEKERTMQRDALAAVENIEVNITDKVNEYAYSYGLKFCFEVVIQNNYNKAINYVEGILKIKDLEGNQLTYGTAYFGTTSDTTSLGYKFPPNSRQTYTLTWENDLTDGAVEIWESEYSDLKFSFEITRIRVENNEIVEVKSNP